MEKIKAFIRLALAPIVVFFVAGISDTGSFIEMASTIGGVALLVPIFVEFFKTKFNLKDKIFWGIKSTRAVSWGLGILFSYIGYFAGWGYFGELTHLYMPLIAGLGVGLISNGYFTIEMVQQLLYFIFNTLKTENGDKK